MEQITENSEPSNYLVWSPKGDRIAYTLGGIINILTLETNESVTLENGTINHGKPDWSPQGE